MLVGRKDREYKHSHATHAHTRTHTQILHKCQVPSYALVAMPQIANDMPSCLNCFLHNIIKDTVDTYTTVFVTTSW